MTASSRNGSACNLSLTAEGRPLDAAWRRFAASAYDMADEVGEVRLQEGCNLEGCSINKKGVT